MEWEQIRGKAGEVIRFGQPDCTLAVEMELGGKLACYSITIAPDESGTGVCIVTREELRTHSNPHPR